MARGTFAKDPGMYKNRHFLNKATDEPGTNDNGGAPTYGLNLKSYLLLQLLER